MIGNDDPLGRWVLPAPRGHHSLVTSIDWKLDRLSLLDDGSDSHHSLVTSIDWKLEKESQKYGKRLNGHHSLVTSIDWKPLM